MTIVASAISPMAIASPASENRLMVWSNADERQRGEQRAEQQHADRRHRRADVLQRDGDDEDDDDQLVDDAPGRSSSACPRSAPSGRRSGRSRCPPAATALSSSSFCSSASRHGQDVAALLHDGDAADDLAGAVEIGDAAPQVVADLQVADVLAAAPAGPLGRGRGRGTRACRGSRCRRRRAADTRGW